jgi:hypothetical protein
MELHEAMITVLREHGDWMDRDDLAREIASRGLYHRKDGSHADGDQSGCGPCARPTRTYSSAATDAARAAGCAAETSGVLRPQRRRSTLRVVRAGSMQYGLPLCIHTFLPRLTQ